MSEYSVWCVFEDCKGFIWIGTHKGPNRYDGIKFKLFKYDINDPISLSGNEVTSLLEDKFGNLWVGTSGGLNKYNLN